MALTSEHKASRLFKALMGVSETRLARDFFEEPIRTAASVLPSQVWKYGDRIPDGTEATGGEAALDQIRALQHANEWTYRFDESTVRPIVRRWKEYQLTAIDGGTHNSFQALDGEGKAIRNIIPFNFGDGYSYNYNLYKKGTAGATGAPIAFGVGEWVLDTASGVLTFYGDIPSGVDAANPPKISFYQYVGGLGIPETVTGFEGVVVPITNVEGTANVAAWNTEVNSDLTNRINVALDQVWPEYTPTFDWDGADDNEGVAVAFEKMIPLRYSHSLNPVKSGIGMSADSEVVSLMVRRHIVTNVATGNGFTVDFASQKMPTQSGVTVLRYESGSLWLSLDGGSTWGAETTDFNTLAANSAVKVVNGDAFVVVRRTAGNLSTDVFTAALGISNTQTTVGFFYWDTESSEYMPWVNGDPTAKFDFGVPIVMKLGKIPASIKISQMGSGGFADSITPEYYGVRAETVVIAVKSDTVAHNTPLPEGVDYLVKNEPGAYLEDIIDKILADRGNGFGGKILMRTGRYKVNRDFTLNDRYAGWKLEGESRSSVTISSEVSRDINITAGTAHSNVYFENLQFVGAFRIVVGQNSTHTGYASLTNVWGPDVDVLVADKCNITILNCPSLHNLSIVGATLVLGDRLIATSVLNNINHNGNKTIYRGVTAQIFTGEGGGVQSWIDSSYFNSLASLELNNQFSNNTVLSYEAAVPERFRMETGFIEVIDTTDRAGERRFTTFADPIIYDTVLKRFTLEIDDRTLEIKDGRLWVKAAADVILFDPNGVARPYDTYEIGTRGAPVTATNVQAALADLYLTKADLVAGKLPLQQLPEAVAHAGLSFKGMWSFEESAGAYPSQTDVSDYDFDGVAEFPVGIQPGWFLIVKNSTEPNNPAAEQIAVAQGEDDPIVFTAGDWLIYNGTKWEKVDNSVANAVFSLLPNTPPSRGGAQWDEAAGGPGLLALGNTTLVDSIDLVNEILRKLAPPKPKNLSQMTLIARTPGAYTAKESDGHQVRSNLVYNNVRVSYGTIGDNTANTGTITDLFFDGDSGVLEAYIDNAVAGTKALTTADDRGTYDALVVTADADPHLGVSGQEDFWKGLRARVDPTDDLALGPHTYALKHSVSGTTPEQIFYVDNPAPTAGMSITGAMYDPPAADAYYVSGVPSVAAGAPFVLTDFTANNVVGKFYNSTAVAIIECNVTNVTAKSLMPSVLPTEPADGSYANAAMPGITINMPATAYSETIVFTYKPRNSKGDTNSGLSVNTMRRIDTTPESIPNTAGTGVVGTKIGNRVRSGSPTERFPIVGTGAGQCGEAFISTESLVGPYEGELQRINNKYRWPDGSYTDFGGPNYINAPGITVAGATQNPWRWATFRIDNIFSNVSAFTLIFTNTTGTWSASAATNQVTSDIMIFARVVGASETGWLNCNAPYSGAGTPFEDNAPAMVSSDSSAKTKRVTFGATTRTGTLYLRVALLKTSGLEFGGLTVGDLA